MYFIALATDYDGTLAEDGVVADETVAALRSFRQSGRKLLLVTGLELQIVFNKGAVMVLPAGVNKASGLAAALARLRLSPLNVVGIGDAENDHAFLRACGCAVAVANALPMVKADAEIVTSAPRGAGVVEMVRRILEGDLAEIAPTIERQTVEIARDPQGEPVRLHPQCGGVLIVGTSGGGKSTAATGLIEKIIERGFQLCVIDPEGDYADLENALALGDAKSPPRLPEIVELLGKPEQSLVVTLLGVDVAERPRFLAEFMPALSSLRVETARPHWLVIDEAHHLLPSAWNGAPLVLPQEFAATILITVQAEHVAAEALQGIDYILALGNEADRAVRSFCKAVEEPPPSPPGQRIAGQTTDRGQALFWSRHSHKLRL